MASPGGSFSPSIGSRVICVHASDPRSGQAHVAGQLDDGQMTSMYCGCLPFPFDRAKPSVPGTVLSAGAHGPSRASSTPRGTLVSHAGFSVSAPRFLPFGAHSHDNLVQRENAIAWVPPKLLMAIVDFKRNKEDPGGPTPNSSLTTSRPVASPYANPTPWTQLLNCKDQKYLHELSVSPITVSSLKESGTNPAYTPYLHTTPKAE